MGASASSASASAAAAASCSRFCSAVRIWYVRMNANIISSTTPSQRAMVRSGAMAPSSSTAARMDSGQSRRSSVLSITSGQTAADRPATISRLKMFEPTTLPTAISFAPRRAAVTLTASSGMDVPNATMVRPISSGDTPSLRASADAPATNLSAPQIISAKPITRNTNDSIQFPPSFPENLGQHRTFTAMPLSPTVYMLTREFSLDFRLQSTKKDFYRILR